MDSILQSKLAEKDNISTVYSQDARYNYWQLSFNEGVAAYVHSMYHNWFVWM